MARRKWNILKGTPEFRVGLRYVEWSVQRFGEYKYDFSNKIFYRLDFDTTNFHLSYWLIAGYFQLNVL